MSRIEIDLTDIADDPENIEIVTDKPIHNDEWIFQIGDVILTIRTDQLLSLQRVINEIFGDD